MGRRPDPPQVQKAKGNPGRRKSAVAKREEEIARVAKLLADSPVDPANPLAPPAIIDRGPMSAAAIAVWEQMAPKLASTHRLQHHHRFIFAMFCVYFAEWVTANEDCLTKGLTQSVATVAGGSMERIRPIVKIRDAAFDQVMKLSPKFGLTPMDEYDLFKQQQIAAGLNPGLFDSTPQKQSEAPTETPPAQGSGAMIGALKRLDSKPPANQVN